MRRIMLLFDLNEEIMKALDETNYANFFITSDDEKDHLLLNINLLKKFSDEKI